MKLLKRLSIVMIIVLTLSLILLGGCVSSQLINVTVAEVTHSVFYAPQYVALAEGYFEEEGLEVDFVNTKGADKTMAALLSDQAQIGFMGPEASVYVYNKGKEDYAINFAQLTQRDGSFLLGREKVDNFDFNMLKGKTIIGGRKGGMPEMTLEYVLRKHGLEPGVDVEVRTDIQFSVMAGAFKGGEGDYVTLFEPTATTMEASGGGHIVASIGEEGGYIPYTCYSSKKSYIEENPEVIQKFTNAIYKGMKYVENNEAAAIAKSIQPYFESTDIETLTTLVDRYKNQDTWKPDLVLTEEGLNHMMDIIDGAIGLDKRAPYKDIVNTDFAKKAMK